MSNTSSIGSDQVNDLASALAKAQGEFKPIEKNKQVTVRTNTGPGYTFEYADLTAIIDACKDALVKNGICYTHALHPKDGGESVLVTMLIHSSGQYLASYYPLPRSADPKQLGGAITYGKRYCLSALLGVAADDDADVEPENVTEFKNKKPAGLVIAPKGNDTRDIRKELSAAMKQYGWSAQQVTFLAADMNAENKPTDAHLELILNHVKTAPPGTPLFT